WFLPVRFAAIVAPAARRSSHIRVRPGEKRLQPGETGVAGGAVRQRRGRRQFGREVAGGGVAGAVLDEGRLLLAAARPGVGTARMKAAAGGGASGLGTSPASSTRSRRRPGSGTGTADRRARV